MAYKFGADESVRHAILRTGREELDRAISELSEGINQDPAPAIHAARKAIKKERSLLRLTRGAISPKQRRRENARLREAARSLSDARDAEVMITSVKQLSERFVGQVPATTFDALTEHLESRKAVHNGRRGASGMDMRAVQELGAVRLRVDDWELRKGGWKALESGLVRSYKRGQQALADARASRDSEDLHAWRKRVKDLWYHERLLAPTCGPTARGQVKELHRVSDLLGDDHDLGLLRRELTHDAPAIAVDLAAIVKLIDHRRDELQAEALKMGRRVYAETPKAFRRRMRASWKAGRALARAPRDQHPAELAAAIREPGSA